MNRPTAATDLMRWPDDAACGRCGGTGIILWAGIYSPHGSGNIKGPCIRCRPADFCERIGLGYEAARLRRAA